MDEVNTGEVNTVEVKQEAVVQEEPKHEAAHGEAASAPAPRPEGTPAPTRPDAGGQRRENRPPREGHRPEGNKRNDRPQERGGEGRSGEGRGGENRGREDRGRDDRGRGERREGPPRPGQDRRPDFTPEIELEKLISDSLYLDNQAHAVVARMRDMDSGTKSQLRRLYNAVRRAVRAPENERQHQFVMLRARLAYTIARHSLRSLDALERLLLQVTRKNEARGYERFKDLFEAIVAYNE